MAIAIALGIVSPNFVPLSLAQDPPAETFQPGYWQPVGRFNPKKAVKIKLVNETGLDLDYDITNLESFNPDIIVAGSSRLIENFGEEAYIMVYPKDASQAAQDRDYVLKFSIAVDQRTQEIPADNIAVITVIKAEPGVASGFYGHRTINLQKTGAFYFY